MPKITISSDTLNRALQGIASIDLNAAWVKLRSGDIQAELQVGEEAADIISAFWPEAKYAEDVMKLIGFIIALRQAGVWTDAQPEDPAMQHAAGNTGQGTPAMHSEPVIVPGGTREDPYAFDTH